MSPCPSLPIKASTDGLGFICLPDSVGKDLHGSLHIPKELFPRKCETFLGCRGRAFWDCTKLNMRCFEAEPKMGKGGDQGGLRRNKHGKIKGQRDDKGQSILNTVSPVHLTGYALYVTSRACSVLCSTPSLKCFLGCVDVSYSSVVCLYTFAYLRVCAQPWCWLNLGTQCCSRFDKP